MCAYIHIYIYIYVYLVAEARQVRVDGALHRAPHGGGGRLQRAPGVANHLGGACLRSVATVLLFSSYVYATFMFLRGQGDSYQGAVSRWELPGLLKPPRYNLLSNEVVLGKRGGLSALD